MIREALYFDRLPDRMVQCRLCPADCKLKPGQYGICRCRVNDNGILKTTNFGETVTVALDPIEKKPLYHFLPGADIISIGANGCNFSCRHCQNWQISQEKSNTFFISPQQLAAVGAQRGSIGVAYTYTEPMIWYEYILEAGPYIREAGLVNVLVTNGYINLEPLTRLLPLVDAFNIDLKGMRPEFYTHVCKGRLEPVLEVIRLVAASRAHLELTNLVIPGHNDTEDDFHKLGEFIASVDKLIPLHLSAYYPHYQMDEPATPPETLRLGYDILRRYVPHVFVGNLPLSGCSDSHCQACGHLLISRTGYSVELAGLDGSRCAACGAESGIIRVRAAPPR